MGEIDTKPIESVQAALTFFEHSNEHRRFHTSPTNDQQEGEKEREMESLERELANAKVQLEAKDSACKQAFLKADHYKKTADDLSVLLKNSDLKKNFYINESKDATCRADELESEMERLRKELNESHSAALSQKEAELDSAVKALSELESRLVEKSVYIELLQIQVEQAKEVQIELEKTKEQENEAQVEIALLKFELHKGRSKQAAAEAAEARAQSEKTALYNALQQLGLEAEETKKENRMLKEALALAEHQSVKPNEEAEREHEEEREVHDDEREREDMKRELEAAIAKIGELRIRAEQAISRAEAAEKAKAALEEQNKKRREHKERRKAAYAALRQESREREFEENSRISAKNYQPLGKVLNMKF